MNKGKLTIKQEGMAMLFDQDKVKLSIDGNDKALAMCRSINIKMSLEHPPVATIEMLDIDLDLTDIDYEIDMDELHARHLLLRIKKSLQDENANVVGKDSIIAEIEIITKGME